MSPSSHHPLTIDGQTVQIATAAELVVALDVLQGQYDRQVLAQLRPHLAGLMHRPADFLNVMKSLAPEDQVYLIGALGARLAPILKEARFLRDLLATLAEGKVEDALLGALGRDGLRALILTADELAEVLEWVYGETDKELLEALGLDYVRRLCRTAADLGGVLHSLDNSLQEKLVDQLGWEFVLGLVQDGRGLAALLRALPAAVSDRLLGHFSPEQLQAIIGNARDWAYLYQRLEPDEAATLTQILALNPHGGKAHA